ncbi:MAG: SAM-dependent methyltransferase [Burkholderiales bacterium]|nr:SAM-dependent methyltransferase [Burkholderiales bacterium]
MSRLSAPKEPETTPAEDGEACALPAIRDAIDVADGWISFARFMDLALYGPDSGYYVSGRRKFGREGDFVTASGISGLFGATVARQVAQVLEASAPQVLEFGAGDGRLAADLLNALGESVEGYAILELSPALREAQRATLLAQAPRHAERVTWLDRLPARFDGCVVANEVLDAMPVHLVAWTDGGIMERGVARDGQALTYADRPAQGAVAEAAQDLARRHGIAAPYLSEINLAAQAWTRSLADWLGTGAALLIDYGFPGHEYYHPQRRSGTLMCHHRHRAVDAPLTLAGEADITAHVDFSAVARAASGAGLDILGFATQAAFLIDCGITEILAATPASDARAYLPLANQAQRLLSSAEMGELFKVLAVGRGVGDELVGFARHDRRGAL